MEIIQIALNEGKTTLSEYDAKRVLSQYGIPVTREVLVHSTEELQKAGEKIGFPVVLKGCSENIAHKTEKGLVHIGIGDEEGLVAAFEDIRSRMDDGDDAVLVQEMIAGQRELVAGLVRDPQFGPCVMFGLGGIFTEITGDVTFRVAPLTRKDALDMMEEFNGKKILDAFRGMPAVEREVLADILIAIGRIGIEHGSVKEIDINPLKIRDGKPVAVDALFILSPAE